VVRSPASPPRSSATSVMRSLHDHIGHGPGAAGRGRAGDGAGEMPGCEQSESTPVVVLARLFIAIFLLVPSLPSPRYFRRITPLQYLIFVNQNALCKMSNLPGRYVR
jgi:hypothetical protein